MPINVASANIKKLNDLLEARFGFRLAVDSAKHLVDVREHYDAKRLMLLAEHGMAALTREDYAKSVMICETTRLALREIAPKRLQKKRKQG